MVNFNFERQIAHIESLPAFPIPQKSFFADVVEDVEVILAKMIPRVIAAHSIDHQFAEVFKIMLP